MAYGKKLDQQEDFMVKEDMLTHAKTCSAVTEYPFRTVTAGDGKTPPNPLNILPENDRSYKSIFKKSN